MYKEEPIVEEVVEEKSLRFEGLVPESLHGRLRRFAFDKNQSMGGVNRQSLEEYLTRRGY